jgi:hypothetical protein
MATKAKPKPVAKPQAKDKKPVTIENDPLADLGLESAAPAVASAAAPDATVTTAVTTTVSTEPTANDEVDVGEIEFGFAEFIPTAKRKAEGSKYKFDKLPAPQQKDGKTLYANFTVKLQPGVEEDKLRRSVQSATTQANRQGADEGKYFVSRSGKDKDGTFVMIVFRTDAPPKK